MNAQLSPRGAAVCTILLTLTHSTHVWAQAVDPATRVKAEALFQQADEEMSHGDYGHACPHLEEVIGMLPEAIGAHEALGDCYVALGLTATAWRVYHEAISLAVQKDAKDRIPRIQTKAQGLEGRYATILVQASDASGGAVTLRISLGKHAHDEPRVHVPIPVDRGTHIVEVRKAGHPPTSHTVVIQNDGEHPRIEVPAAPTTPPKVEVVRAWARPLGWTLAGVGVGALASGGILAQVAKQNETASNQGQHCTSTNLCDAIGSPLRDRAVTQANVSIGLLVAGGVLAVGGIGMALALPQSRQAKTGTLYWQVFPTGLLLGKEF